MKTTHIRAVEWVVFLLGMFVLLFRDKIVFPGLEKLLGIEAIVGKENVHYFDDGGYAYTNPGAMIRWTLSVGAVGIMVCACGFWLLFRARRNEYRDFEK